MKIIRKISFTVFALAVLLLPQVSMNTQPAGAADTRSPAEQAVCDSIGGCDQDAGGSIQNTIGTILQILSIVAGIAAVIMLIISGLKFITSQGDSSGISSARNTALYALIGLLVVLFSQFIVRFVLTTATTPPTPPGNSQPPPNAI